MKHCNWLPVSGLLLILLPAAPASAQDAATAGESGWELDAEVAVVSDYRFRGLSLSDKDPAIQPGLTLSHESGVYAGFWGSTIADNGGADIETDFLLGYSGQLGPFGVDVNANLYLYPGASGDNYMEFAGRASLPLGPAELGVTYAFAPAQPALGDISNHYAALDGSLPLGGTPLTLTASFGIEDGAFGDSKLDWSLGANADIAGFSVGLAYVDSARNWHDPLGKATAVLSVSYGF